MLSNARKVIFSPVLTTSSQSKIAFIKSLLNSNKISYYIDNANASVMADTLPTMTVMVAEKQYKIAEDLLREVDIE